MRMTRKDLLSIPHREFRNEAVLSGNTLGGVSTDSRAVKPGDLFVAVKGERFDGHAFLPQAFSAGAAAAVVQHDVAIPPGVAGPLLVVDDTTKALGALARTYRSRFDIPVIAIAGSNGKTTTKDMIAAVLRQRYAVLSTEGNLNNHFGVPHTLFRLEKKHDIAVIEIGTNHPGEIAYLCDILRPTYGLLTNIGREHLQFLGSLDGVAAEEGMLFAFLSDVKHAAAIVNADDARVVTLSSGIAKRALYGFAARRAAVRGNHLTLDETGRARFEFTGERMNKSMAVHLAVPGPHNALNALAAAATGLMFRVAPGAIRDALQAFRPASRRMEAVSIGGVLVFNDAYNANPDSTVAALKTLSAVSVPGKKIVVLGDMLELGAGGPEEHRRVGLEVAALGFEYLLTYGSLARHIHDAAGVRFAAHYDQKNILAEYLAELVAPGDAVLVKGSRGLRMEDIVTFLQERLRAPLLT